MATCRPAGYAAVISLWDNNLDTATGIATGRAVKVFCSMSCRLLVARTLLARVGARRSGQRDRKPLLGQRAVRNRGELAKLRRRGAAALRPAQGLALRFGVLPVGEQGGH